MENDGRVVDTCTACEGRGYTWEHTDHDPHGDCVGCPVPEFCVACNRTGFQTQQNTNDEISVGKETKMGEQKYYIEYRQGRQEGQSAIFVKKVDLSTVQTTKELTFATLFTEKEVRWLLRESTTPAWYYRGWRVEDIQALVENDQVNTESLRSLELKHAKRSPPNAVFASDSIEMIVPMIPEV